MVRPAGDTAGTAHAEARLFDDCKDFILPPEPSMIGAWIRQGQIMKSEYDLSSAVTFLLVGLGLGSALTLLFGPSTKPENSTERINSWRQGEKKSEWRHRLGR